MKKFTIAAIPYSIYALIFFVAPLILVLFYSVTGPDGTFTLENFARFFDFDKPVYMLALWRSVYLAVISTIICLLLGYPMAYILSKLSPRVRGFLSLLFVLPMWMNFLLRTYAWMTLLEKTGIINTFLERLGLPALNIMYTEGAIILGNVYNFLPFMILPIYTVLIKIDHSVIEAAQDLGANGMHVFFRVIIPLSLPGVMSGISMTFMPAVTTFIISRLLGGGKTAMIGDLIENQFKVVGDWGFGSAMSVIIMVMILFAMHFMSNYEKEQAEGGLLL